MNHWPGRALRNRRYFFSLLSFTLALSLGLWAGAQQEGEKAKLVPAKDTKETAPAAAESKPESELKPAPGSPDRAGVARAGVEAPGSPDRAGVARTGVEAPELKPEYVVGEGDALHIDVWQEPEVSQNVVVRPDGKVSLPLVNEVKVSGMTPLQIQALVADKLKTFVNQPKVTVTVTEVHSRKAFITGEVAHPGEYSLNTQVTVLQLIAQAGGFTPFAKTESIMILRVSDGKEQRLRFKYKEVLRGKNTEQNIALEPGDTVVVP